MDATTLSGLAGVLLSLAFSYGPGLSDKFEQQDSTKKRLIMAIVLIAAALVVFGLGCASLWPAVTCDKDGATGLARALLAALVTNQATFQISPPKAAKP